MYFRAICSLRLGSHIARKAMFYLLSIHFVVNYIELVLIHHLYSVCCILKLKLYLVKSYLQSGYYAIN